MFALASIGQLIVGHFLDKLGPRIVFMTAAFVQLVFFSLDAPVARGYDGAYRDENIGTDAGAQSRRA